MTVTSQALAERVPAGTYRVDPVHSSARFEVEHGAISPYRGGFGELTGTLDAGPDGLALSGAVDVTTVDVEEPDLRGHLLSPEFFDAERHPRISFVSRRLRVDGDALEFEGELEMRGATNRIEARGTLRGPASGADGSSRVALEIETTVDRRDYGLDWQLELPGGGIALGYDVKLTVVLELVRD